MCYTIPSLLYSFERNRSSILAYFDGCKAKKRPPTGAFKLLRAAVSLYSSFQPILLSKLTCCLPTLVGIRRGQTDSEASAVDLKGQTALFVIVGLSAQVGICCRIFFQPLLERGIMCLNFDDSAGFIKKDAGRFLPFSQSSFHIVSISACSTKTGAFSSFFRIYTCRNRLIFEWGAPGRCAARSGRSYSVKFVFLSSTRHQRTSSHNAAFSLRGRKKCQRLLRWITPS